MVTKILCYDKAMSLTANLNIPYHFNYELEMPRPAHENTFIARTGNLSEIFSIQILFFAVALWVSDLLHSASFLVILQQTTVRTADKKVSKPTPT